MLRLVLLLVHISAAAMLFGAPMGLVGSVKRALAAGDEALKLAATDAQRRGKLAGIGSMLTLLTGLALIFNAGGFGAVSTNYHAALAVMLGAIGFSAGVMRPSTAGLVAAASAVPVDRSGAQAAVKRLAMGSGVLHSLWLVTLFLMLYRF